MTPDSVQRDTTGQWWATHRGHYLLAVTDAEAVHLAGHGRVAGWDHERGSASFDAVLAKHTAGEPVAVTLWQPPLPTDYDRIVIEHEGRLHAVLERSDGALVTASAQYLDLIIDHWHHQRTNDDTFDMVRREQMGGISAAIRFRCGDRVFAYLMPIINRELVG